jgi:ribosomal protein S18 acetylase RimI-like enzyme
MDAMEILVRPYRPEDRQMVRDICYATGYMGDSPDWYWRDVESFSDLWSRYYTDREPESLLVGAGPDDVVVGYLLGCVDTTKENEFNRLLGYHALRRYCLLRPGTAGYLWRTVADVLRDNVVGRRPLPAPLHDQRWPAHLHINLLPEARAQGLGRQLMRRWLDRLHELQVPGCHVDTMAENRSAVAFFEATGFVKYRAPVMVPGMRLRQGGRMHVQRLVQDLRAEEGPEVLT